MPFNLGLGEVLVVLVVALIVFGGRLPQVGRSLGQGLREFKQGIRGIRAQADDEAVETEATVDSEPTGDAVAVAEMAENEDDPDPEEVGPTPADRSP